MLLGPEVISWIQRQTIRSTRQTSRPWKVTIQGGVDKSLAPPTSRCRKTESIVSFERGVCSCAELQVFSCYRGWKEARQATRAISTTSRRELLSLPSARQGAEGIHAILKETLGEHAPWYATVKTGSPSLNVVIFPPVMRLVLDDPKQWPPPRSTLFPYTTLFRSHCFGSSRTRRITGGKIVTFKLVHPVFDSGIRWCMFP